jgi:hypothetical protein
MPKPIAMQCMTADGAPNMFTASAADEQWKAARRAVVKAIQVSTLRWETTALLCMCVWVGGWGGYDWEASGGLLRAQLSVSLIIQLRSSGRTVRVCTFRPQWMAC